MSNHTDTSFLNTELNGFVRIVKLGSPECTERGCVSPEEGKEYMLLIDKLVRYYSSCQHGPGDLSSLSELINNDKFVCTEPKKFTTELMANDRFSIVYKANKEHMDLKIICKKDKVIYEADKGFSGVHKIIYPKQNYFYLYSLIYGTRLCSRKLVWGYYEFDGF